MRTRKHFVLLPVLAVFSVLAAGCGSSKTTATATSPPTGGGSTAPPGSTAAPTTGAPTTEAATTTSAPAPAPTCTAKAPDPKALDFSGDGKLVVAAATPGPRDDGAYYQALVECVDRFAKANGGSSLVVDKIPAADAATQLENLAKQEPDIIMVGASEIAKPLPDLSAKYAKVFWYCNCGAGQQANPGYAQSQDDGSEINYTAGIATGLLLKAAGKDKAAFIGNNNLNFEVESFEAFKLGLQAVDPTYTATYYATGDFNDVPKATEAYNTAKSQGAAAIYPFLGGAHEPVVKLANKDNLIVMSAGKSDACTRTDVTYQIAVRFDAGDYLDTILKEIIAGTYKEGDIRTFHVGKDPEPGAVICKPTADQTTAMQKAYDDVASGKLDEQFLAIKKKAYNF
jgi:basic membrane lipoprotein Med (substrate-binding protein (PBP1-ABC) superfamily)